MKIPNALKNGFIAIIAVAGFGMIRMPLQESILEREKAAGLIQEPLDLPASESLEQQFSMVALGGLRSLVAAILNMDAFDCFLKADWTNLERRYYQIVALSPHSDFYWDNGAWHLGCNASSNALDNIRLSPMEQREEFHKFIRKGRQFIEKGVQLNPKSWFLHYTMGNMYADIYRQPDFEKAAAAFHRAAELGGSSRSVRSEFYALARVPSKAKEALELGRKLFETPRFRTPSLVCNIFALENRLNLPSDQRIPFKELFGTDQEARELLQSHLENTLRYPTDGIRETLQKLPKTIEPAAE